MKVSHIAERRVGSPDANHFLVFAGLQSKDSGETAPLPYPYFSLMCFHERVISSRSTF